MDGGWIEKVFWSLGQISVWIEAVLAARDVRWPCTEVRLTVLLLVQVVQTNASKLESVDTDRCLLREAFESLGDEELKVVTEPILSQLKAMITAASKALHHHQLGRISKMCMAQSTTCLKT